MGILICVLLAIALIWGTNYVMGNQIREMNKSPEERIRDEEMEKARQAYEKARLERGADQLPRRRGIY